MPQDALDLPERVLVTGAAGGIGAAVVERLLRAGVQVIATDLVAAHQAGQTAQGAPAGRGACQWISADLATAAGRQSLLDQVLHAGAHSLGGLVHVAGMLDPVDWDQVTEAQVERLLALNLLAPFFLTRGLLPVLAADASVVLMGSVSALRASPKTPFYSASKAALRNLGASLAMIVQPRGMRVNVVAPGLIDTPLTDALNLRLAHERGLAVGQVAAERAQAIPAGRPGTADEVASACLFFLSRQSAYCTGTTLHPTGGVWAGTI
jgi:3-oxoacyl-[acyl-carrier protein] reductase